MRINGEYDNCGLSEEEIRARNEMDEPAQPGLNEKEKIKELQYENTMLKECILEMSQVVYDGQ
ncbi:hypothetical protein [Terrisporobacter glycolicus]|uniref:Transposase n=1 Tax=Terrisporobacter glycolicus ATCC 14880 = DSM 1288 TaxID=1121315 RepID=A0ABZ2EWC5_9FIRM|nr:hypothetical protein [Terrisporobacter glycolicus]